MIEGRISLSVSPIIKTVVVGSRARIAVERILDTGFDGYICLPITTAVTLGLELIDLQTSELVDGTILEDEPIFSGKIEWDGEVIETYIVLTKSADTLLGTALLRGMEVRMNYSTREVVIEKAKETRGLAR
jgi:Predicted aspartyl protease